MALSCLGGCGRDGAGTVPMGAALTTTMRRTPDACMASVMALVPFQATPSAGGQARAAFHRDLRVRRRVLAHAGGIGVHPGSLGTGPRAVLIGRVLPVIRTFITYGAVPLAALTPGR
jgi:hypothetical protein